MKGIVSLTYQFNEIAIMSHTNVFTHMELDLRPVFFTVSMLIERKDY